MADQEPIAPEPETTGVPSVVVHSELGGGYSSLAYLIDAAGVQYVACANSNFNNNNITFVDLYVVPAGQGLTQAPQYRITPQNKIDNVSLFNSGHDLLVTLESHTLGGVPGDPRPINIEQARIAGIFHTTPQFEAERGGEGAVIVPQQPSDGGLTAEQVTTIVRTQLGLRDGEASLIGQFAGAAPVGSSTVRKGLGEKAEGSDKNAMVYLFDTANYATDPQVKKFQDEFYTYVANLVYGTLRNFGDQVGYKAPHAGPK